MTPRLDSPGTDRTHDDGLELDRTPPAVSGLGAHQHRKVAPFAAVAAAVAWVAFLGIALAVQPPLDPDAPVNVLAELLSIGVFGSLFAAIAGLATRATFGLGATAIGGLFLTATAIVCYADGHTGAWVLSQGMAGIGLAGTGWATYKVTS